MRTVLLALVLASATVLAGCITTLPGGGNVDLGAPLDAAGAKTLLDAAAKAKPEKHGFTMAATKNGAEILRMTSATDEAAKTTYMTMRGDPSAFPSDGEGGPGGEFLRYGLSMWMTKDVVVYSVNKTAYAVGKNESDSNGFDGGFKDFNLDELMGDLPNGTVSAPTLVAHNGKAAVRVTVTTKEDGNEPAELTVITYRDPARLARVTGLAPDEGKENDPLKGAVFTIDFAYDADVTTNPGERLTRAAALSYKGGNPYGNEPRSTWTFQASGGLPLGEIEAQVKRAPDEHGSGGSMPEPDKLTTLWSMRFTEKTKSQAGVTLTFTDKDNDGKVSKGDTLLVDLSGATGGERPTVVLFDTRTQTYVIPGAGVAFALAALAAVALVLRRRA